MKTKTQTQDTKSTCFNLSTEEKSDGRVSVARSSSSLMPGAHTHTHVSGSHTGFYECGTRWRWRCRGTKPLPLNPHPFWPLSPYISLPLHPLSLCSLSSPPSSPPRPQPRPTLTSARSVPRGDTRAEATLEMKPKLERV